ncbi:hypothetical protein [Roseibium album]|uniref:hypothetical protein n=1 Tax=Roseibium album TaxID=311410 RepID=UPI002492B8B3|nr:hypothetical protein [Roseibium album]MCR9055786.1 hypothetical protein [Paracoccaceae bacterium]
MLIVALLDEEIEQLRISEAPPSNNVKVLRTREEAILVNGGSVPVGSGIDKIVVAGLKNLFESAQRQHMS